jgi:hypothetical protein
MYPAMECPNCHQSKYIPNTSSHRWIYMFTFLLDILNTYVVAYLCGYKLITYKNNIVDQFVMGTIVLYYIYDMIRIFPGGLKDFRSNVIVFTKDNPLNEGNNNIRVDIEFEDHTQNLKFSMDIGLSFMTEGVMEVITYYLIGECRSKPKDRYIWFIYIRNMVHLVCIHYVYPYIYSILYAQNPADYVESKLFCTKFSVVIGLMYMLIFGLGGAIYSYIMTHSKTHRVSNPKTHIN